MTPGNGTLPAQLSATLPAGFRAALDHPVRRQIVRILNEEKRERTPAELTGREGIDETIAMVSYHARRLLASGLLESHREPGGRAASCGFWSVVADSQRVRLVLQVVAASDRELLARSSPGRDRV